MGGCQHAYDQSVPSTRTQLDRDQKMAAIVAAARRRLLGGGYDALSVADVSRELGLAQNAIYWYFPSKDHLFVAAVEQILHDILSRKPRTGPALGRVVWFAERLHEFQGLRVAMRDRARNSPVIAKFERDVVALLRVMLIGAIRGEIEDDRLDDTVDTVMALCEGILLRDYSKPRRAQLIRFGYERLVEERKVTAPDAP